jgi:RNA polymerase sigma-70 factor, ECF subfamily
MKGNTPNGTGRGDSAYNRDMQCVGTLSWSMVGLAPAVRQPFGRDRRDSQQTPAVKRAPAVRQPFGRDQRGSEQQPARQFPAAGAAMAPGAQAARVEVRGLEQDWSQIVRRCIDGDSGAWAEMVRTHQRRVYGLCYRFTGNAADAEDLTQDVFLKIYSNLGSFDAARGSLPVWIATMTRNLLVDNFRRTRNQRATSSLDEGWDQTEELKPTDRLVASGPTPHENATRNELARMVQGALTKVSVELREAVILRDLQDLDYKEIAQVLGIPEGTVKSRISRGRAELARLLERSQKEVM